jgi:PAS domain S-box-containing protein
MSSTIRLTSAIAFGVVAVVLAVVSTFSYGTVRRSADANQSVAHTYQVLSALDQVLITMVDAETDARGFAATRVGRYLESFAQADAALAPKIDTLATLTADDPVQQRYVSELRTHVNATMGLLRQMISRGQSHEPTSLDLANPEKTNMDVVRADLRQMRAEEQRLMAQRSDDAVTADVRTRALTAVLIAAAFGVLIVSFLLVDRRAVQLREANQSLVNRVRERTAELETAFAAEQTARREAQQAQERFQRLIEAAPTAIVAVDKRGTLVLVNALAEQLFGYPRHELVGKSVDMLVPERFRKNHQQYRADFSGAPEMRQMGAGRDLYAARKDGSEVPVEIGLNPIDVDGEVLVLSSIANITERKQAEIEQHRLHRLAMMPLSKATMNELLAAIVETAITITQADFGNIQLVDAGSSDLKIAAQRGFPQWWIDYWNTVSKGRGTCGTALETGERTIVEDVEQSPIFNANDREMQRKAGVRAVQSTPLISRSGALIGMFSTHYRKPNRPHARTLLLLDLLARQAADIIAQVLAEEDRARLLQVEQQARAEADAANHSKDMFLARVSHELRTPLNALMGWARMLRDGNISPDRMSHGIAAIDRNGDVLNKLVEDLVDMSRMATGKLELDRHPLDIAAVVQESVSLLEPAANAKHIQVETNINAGPMTVDGDATRLRQVVWNLLSNAIKFTPSNGTVTLTLRVADGHAEITIADTGQGIAADFLQHVFEPFAQADSSGQGLGLGLAIVHQLVKAHDGSISAASPGVGAGATFTVSLPVVGVSESV